MNGCQQDELVDNRKIKMMKLILIILYLCINSITHSQISAQLRTNFFVNSFTLCPSPGPVKYYGNVTTDNKKQYLNFLVVSPIPLDDNIGGTCKIETLLANSTYIQICEIREKNVCKAMNKYFGEFWYDIERAAQLPAGVCPIRPGRYHVHHYFLDFKNVALQTFPFGALRFTFHGIDKRVKQLLFCMTVEVENKIN